MPEFSQNCEFGNKKSHQRLGFINRDVEEAD